MGDVRESLFSARERTQASCRYGCGDDRCRDYGCRRGAVEVPLADAVAAIRSKAALTTNPAYARKLNEWLALYDEVAKAEPREGLMQVYDWTGRYAGCIGVETWQALVMEAKAGAA